MSVKKADIVIVVCVLLIAAVAGAFFYFRGPGTRVVVTIGGEEYAEYDLSVDRCVELHTQKGTNILVIEDGSARIVSADCPDKLCVSQGRISRDGQMLVCLPHELVVEVTAAVQELDAVSQ